MDAPIARCVLIPDRLDANLFGIRICNWNQQLLTTLPNSETFRGLFVEF